MSNKVDGRCNVGSRGVGFNEFGGGLTGRRQGNYKVKGSIHG